MPKHEQVPVKVNAVCDAGVVPLVEALNAHAALRTTDSCEADGLAPMASVCFSVRARGEADWRTLGELCSRLHAAMQSADAWFWISVHWYDHQVEPYAEIRCPQEFVGVLADKIRLAAPGTDAAELRAEVVEGRHDRLKNGSSSEGEGASPSLGIRDMEECEHDGND